MSIFEMDAKAKTYFDLMEQIDQLTAEAEAIKDYIKSAMMEIEQEEITGHGWRATWHNTKSNRLDSKKLKAERPEVYEAYTVSTTGTRFTLNAIKA